MAKLKVTLVKSRIKTKPKQRGTLHGLGLRKIGQTVTVDDTPSFRGMINVVSHLVSVEEVSGA